MDSKPAVLRKKSTRRKSQKTDAKRHRKQVHCCIENCNGFVVNLPRHIEQVHVDIPRFEAQKLLRKMKKQPRRHYKAYKCPLETCQWKGTRLDKHLVSKQHNMEKDCAKIMTKQIKMSSSQDQPTLGKHMHTARSLAESFLNWFQSIEGGSYIPDFLDDHKRSQKQTQNKKCKHMVQTVLETALGEGEFHASALGVLKSIGRPVLKSGLSVIEKLHKDDRSWGTVKNYLNAFSHFVDFMESSNPLLLDRSTIGPVRVNLRGSIQTVTKMALEELQRRKISDRDRVIDFQNIRQYQQSNIAKTLLNSFEAADSQKDAEEKIHRIARHTLLQIALPNGKRAGVFADMKCSDVKNALTEEDGFVILVGEGKTFRVSGAAGVYCLKTEYELLCNYITKLRPLLKPCTDQVFCRPSGERASVGEIGCYLKDGWTDFGSIVHKDVGDITFTLIRKSIVSKSRSEGVTRDVKEDMAIHMDHDVSTADKHYDVSTGARMTAKFRRIFDKFHDPLDSDDNEDSADVLPSSRLESTGIVLHSGRQGQVSADNDNSCMEPKCYQRKSQNASSFITTECRKGTRSSTFGKLDVFSDEDKIRLYRCCSSLIENGKKRPGSGVTQSEILNQIKSAGPNFSDLFNKYSLAQICNRVRCEIRKKGTNK